MNYKTEKLLPIKKAPRFAGLKMRFVFILLQQMIG